MSIDGLHLRAVIKPLVVHLHPCVASELLRVVSRLETLASDVW